MLLWMLVITFAEALKGTAEGTLSPIEMMASGPREVKVSGSLPLICTIMGAPLNSPKYDWNCVRQAAGGELQFLGWIYPFGNNTGYAPRFQGRVTISADKDKNKVSVQLRTLTAADTATYFCARQHSVTPVEGEAVQKGEDGCGDRDLSDVTVALGNIDHGEGSEFICLRANSVATDKLVFGTGIPLSVGPKSQDESAPEVIVLKSKEPKQRDNKLNVACLARAFYPKNISLDVPQSNLVYELKAPLVTSEGMYGTMKVTGVDPDAEVTCKTVHKGNKAADSITLPEEKPKELETVSACTIAVASAKAVVQMEKVKMLFMAVWGLRFLLTKSIVFSMILSIKLLLF